MCKIRHALGMVAFGGILLSTPVQTAHAAPPVPTNMEGVTTTLAVPPSFDPLKASPQELDDAGFPPRPDPLAAPRAFDSWKRAVTSGARRILPVLTQTNVIHGPVVTHGARNGTSYNWSGYTLWSGVSGYSASSFYFLIGDFVVPIAEQAFGACTGDWVWSSTWIGIDGYNSPDVLQAGIEADAYCSGRSKDTYYSAWYEWYPNYSIRIGGFPIAPGNDIFDEVWSSNSTTGHAFLVNYNTNQAVILNFDAPPGTRLIGDSAEWVVERPGVGGSLATLTNYTQDFFEDAYAYDFHLHGSAPGAPYLGQTASPIVMLDNKGYGISYPSLLGVAGLWFHDTNSARFAGSP